MAYHYSLYFSTDTYYSDVSMFCVNEYFFIHIVIEAYNDAASSMARLNRTGAQLMHKHGRSHKATVAQYLLFSLCQPLLEIWVMEISHKPFNCKLVKCIIIVVSSLAYI